MNRIHRPHVLGIDDGPFDKRKDAETPIVGVMMEGHDLVEAVAVSRFPVDGDKAAEFLAGWIRDLRFCSSLHAVVLGGVTVAGLGIVDIDRLSVTLSLPVIVVNRHDPNDHRVAEALRAAGLEDRIPTLERVPEAWKLTDGVFVTHAGADRNQAARLVRATTAKSSLPEPLRLAHLIGAALIAGQSRGRA